MSMIYCTATDKHIDTDYDAEHQVRCEECGDIRVHEDYPGEWLATRGDYDLGHLIGHAKTRQGAIDDLIEQEENQ